MVRAVEEKMEEVRNEAFEQKNCVLEESKFILTNLRTQRAIRTK
jgi:hypothetical protein